MGRDSVPEGVRHLVDSVVQACETYGYAGSSFESEYRPKLVELEGELARHALLELVNELVAVDERLTAMTQRPDHRYPYDKPFDTASRCRWGLLSSVDSVIKGKTLPLTGDDYSKLFGFSLQTGDPNHRTLGSAPFAVFVGALEAFARKETLSEALLAQLHALVALLGKTGPQREAAQLRTRVEKLIGAEPAVDLVAGEAWSDAALGFLASLGEESRKHWTRLLAHCQQPGSGPPTGKWLQKSKSLIEAIGEASFTAPVLEWVPLIEVPRVGPATDRHHGNSFHIADAHQQILKGLIQCVTLCDGAPFAKPLTSVALWSYTKVAAMGPRSIRIGNACTWTLARIGEGELAALALLRVRVKARAGQKAVEDAFTEISERTGVARDDLDDLGVPAYGFEEVGVRREELGSFVAELVLTPRAKAELRVSSEGKTYKSVPAAVKQNHKEEITELKEVAEDAETMLRAQRQRLDGLFTAARSWSFETWRERYLDHPLLGVLARRLIWSLRRGEERASVIWHDGALVDVTGRAVVAQAGTQVVPWHPVEVSVEAVAAWREFLEAREIEQPFKQAHREVYLLTDAERTTATYSNRFASHVLKQHQFNALCRERSWNTASRMRFDADYAPPSRDLASSDLRAEFWVESAGERTTDTGAYLYLATDQVRFHRRAAAKNRAQASGGRYASDAADAPGNQPIPLERIPVLVFSEIMRDVDLFVGVSSVGNDPGWRGHAEEAVEHRDYWETYSFGALDEFARTRRSIIERLLPRLKIAGQCELLDRFLVVKGKVASYKIHLGSSNVLMHPSGHYLCIVQASPPVERIYLPFDGDGRLATILSKAFLLAHDDKIKDPSISGQIQQGLA